MAMNLDTKRANDRTRKAERRVELRARMLEFMAGKSCIVCGESDPVVLQFNHIDPKQKRANVATMLTSGGYKWDTIMSEINKCNIMCANCHMRHTAKQFSWYNR